MSSPLSTLNKSHRAPLPRVESANRSTSVRLSSDIDDGQKKEHSLEPNLNSDDETLLAEVTGSIVRRNNSARKKHERIDPFTNSLTLVPDRKIPKSHTVSAKVGTAPTDTELMAVMMARLSLLEGRLQHNQKQIRDKDRTIQILENKLDLMEKLQKDRKNSSYNVDLETKCLLQEEKIQQMEGFLADYGLKWVGESEESSESEAKTPLWQPGRSVPQKFKVNHDAIEKSVKDLNIIAGEGASRIQRTSDGARLKSLKSIPLIVYENGIVLYDGPFRSILEPSTQVFLQDLQDGFFPSELQDKYPDGVPFQLTDKRSVYFVDKRQRFFGGSGQVLGKSEATGIQTLSEESEIPGKRLTVNRFLNNLPQSVIKDGKIIPVRSEISATLTGYEESQSAKISVDFPNKPPEIMIQKESSKNFIGDDKRTLLRIRSLSGGSVITMRVKPESTVAEIHRRIEKKNDVASGSYMLVLPYPQTVLSNVNKTIQDYGIANNTVLLMKKKN